MQFQPHKVFHRNTSAVHCPGALYGYSDNQRWEICLLKVSRYLLLLPATKNISLQLHISYLENKVTVIILHIILLLQTTQQFSNNVS